MGRYPRAPLSNRAIYVAVFTSEAPPDGGVKVDDGLRMIAINQKELLYLTNAARPPENSSKPTRRKYTEAQPFENPPPNVAVENLTLGGRGDADISKQAAVEASHGC